MARPLTVVVVRKRGGSEVRVPLSRRADYEKLPLVVVVAAVPDEVAETLCGMRVPVPLDLFVRDDDLNELSGRRGMFVYYGWTKAISSRMTAAQLKRLARGAFGY